MSQVEIANDKERRFTGLALALLSVSLSYQRKGIGGEIVDELDKRVKTLNYQFVIY